MSDYISRQEAIAVAEKELSAKYNRREMAVGFCGFRNIIENVPAADVRENVRGKWIDIWDDFRISTKCKCNRCNKESERPVGNFCKWCGADMRGEQDG